MKIYLLFPPHWTPTMPHMALPVLTGWMRRHGHQVTQRDLNVEIYDEILTHRHQHQALEQIRRRFGTTAASAGSKGTSDAYGRPTPEQLAWALKKGPFVAKQVEAAKATLRSPEFYNGAVWEPAFFTLAAALELDSLSHFPARLDLGSFTNPGRPDSSRDLLRAARSPQINPFYDIFRRGILQDLLRDRPDLVGISIPTQGQFLAGLTLAALIRDAGLKCHITTGGPHMTMLREQVTHVPALFDLIDSVVLFDGEIPLLRLAEALEAGKGPEGAPNLVYRASGSKTEIRTNPALAVEDLRATQQEQQPDFDGLPLDRYLAPELVLPLATTHGCYHGKCAFCNVVYGGTSGYSPIATGHIVAQIRSAEEKYHCRNFFFVDEAITPHGIRQLSPALRALETPIHWASAARFEKALTDTLLAEAEASGCRMLLFGLESASQPVMDKMVKGTQVQEMSRILRAAAPLGIWNHTFFFFGFPGETLSDAQETVNFVYEHQDVIHSGSPGAFLLEIYSPAYREPEKYGITRIYQDPARDLAIYFEYDLASGLDEATANKLSDRLVDQLPVKRFGMYYLSDVYKFLYASELRRRNQPLPQWIE
jgi:hypothetical protein